MLFPIGAGMVFRWCGSADGSCYWDEMKEKELLSEFGFGFEAFVDAVSDLDVRQWVNIRYPNQIRTTVLLQGKPYTLAFEPITDEFGTLNKLITFWPTTKDELKKYVERIK